MRPLTPRQAQILELIKRNIADTGMPPTRAEIATRLGFKSANAAEEHLKHWPRKAVLRSCQAPLVVFACLMMNKRSQKQACP